ncbi:DUF5074 domain-containing protein [Parabacteroides pacaensis]|uniref:DUF5074 domain-containing protein n=1 Tax=Parabacteroides pacaensis TaxID=2086575 RepID=UPI00131B93E9|nr:DUF5074 domain-containing protein [Parabacteroides pacaensis]
MKKLVWTCLLFLSMGVIFVSCSDDDDPTVPDVVVTDLTFTDQDDEARKIGGDLTWEALAANSGVTGFVIYGSEDGTVRTTKLGDAAASASSFTIAKGTAYTKYLLVVTKNGTGESLKGTSIQVIDSILVPPAAVVSEPIFTDTDVLRGKIGGELTWKTPVENDDITHYVIYSSSDGIERSVLLGEVNFGKNNFIIPAGTNFMPYLVIVTKNSKGEATEQAKVSVSDIYSTACYILHSGKMGSNNSTLAFYNLKTDAYEGNIFLTANGKGIGDTANDIVAYGSKLYMAVTGSNIIYVLDKSGKILQEIQPLQGDEPEKPRYVEPYNGKVYVSMYSGYVACIDTTTMKIEKRVKVGEYPEQLVATGNKLYVTNSGYGIANTVSVIDLNNFTEEKKIKVVLNPTEIAADKDGNVYVISMGNYGDIENTLQKIDPETYQVATITNATKMAVGNDKIYLMYSQYDAEWHQTITFFSYDLASKTVNNSSFITDGTVIAKPYSISIDPSTEDIYLFESDYTTTGSLHIFDSTGKLKKNLNDTYGINPMGAYFY